MRELRTLFYTTVHDNFLRIASFGLIGMRQRSLVLVSLLFPNYFSYWEFVELSGVCSRLNRTGIARKRSIYCKATIDSRNLSTGRLNCRDRSCKSQKHQYFTRSFMCRILYRSRNTSWNYYGHRVEGFLETDAPIVSAKSGNQGKTRAKIA